MKLSSFLALFPVFIAATKTTSPYFGTYQLRSYTITANNVSTNPLGIPNGFLALTPAMKSFVHIALEELPLFPPNITAPFVSGPSDINAAIVGGVFSAVGEWTVDENGVFSSLEIIKSSFTNWNGLNRTSAELNFEIRKGFDGLVEVLASPNSTVEVGWERV